VLCRKLFLGGKKSGFFEPSHTTTYSGPLDLKNIGGGGGTVVHWVEIAKWAKNGQKMGQKWAKNGYSVENFFVSEERRDFFQPSHTTIYSAQKWS
jgi:hypothetical protein